MENNNVKIFVSVIGILILGVIATVIIQSKEANPPSVPGKYDTLAECIKNSGALFYGAFWCPHCAAEKALFGSSVHLLPYVECSNPDGSSQDATCNAKQIESYPTWEFTTSIKLTEANPPTICSKAPGTAGESPTCNQVRSAYGTVWFFPDADIESSIAPTNVGNVWSFAPGSQMRGVAPLQQLADQTGCTVPQ